MRARGAAIRPCRRCRCRRRCGGEEKKAGRLTPCLCSTPLGPGMRAPPFSPIKGNARRSRHCYTRAAPHPGDAWGARGVMGTPVTPRHRVWVWLPSLAFDPLCLLPSRQVPLSPIPRSSSGVRRHVCGGKCAGSARRPLLVTVPLVAH